MKTKFFNLVLLIIFVVCTLSVPTYYINSKFQIKFEDSSAFDDDTFNAVAQLTYEQSINQTGWNNLRITTNKSFSDDEQLEKAGFLEGYVTQGDIYAATITYIETYKSMGLNQDGTLPSAVEQFVQEQFEWMDEQINNQTLLNESNLWQLARSVMIQLKAMYKGYKARLLSDRNFKQYISFDQFYYLTNQADVDDLLAKGNLTTDQQNQKGHCNTFVKIVNNTLLAGHTTWSEYNFMLRIFKVYTFNLNNPAAVAKTISFASRPGHIQSWDDFYYMDTNLQVFETSLMSFNKTNYDTQVPQALPSWMRLNLANRMAANGSEWARIFKYSYLSGTHNSQWGVVDYNKYWSNSTTDILWMVENYYYLYYAEDVTKTFLYDLGYYPSFNCPYNQDIYDISGYAGQQYQYTFFTDPRFKLFDELQSNVTSIESFKWLFRFNNNYTGNPAQSLIPRMDLLKEGELDYYGQARSAYGSIDAKIQDDKQMKNQQAWIINGPTTLDEPIFSFVGEWESSPHLGIPDVMDFDWQLFETFPNEITIQIQ